MGGWWVGGEMNIKAKLSRAELKVGLSLAIMTGERNPQHITKRDKASLCIFTGEKDSQCIVTGERDPQ